MRVPISPCSPYHRTSTPSPRTELSRYFLNWAFGSERSFSDLSQKWRIEALSFAKIPSAPPFTPIELLTAAFPEFPGSDHWHTNKADRLIAADRASFPCDNDHFGWTKGSHLQSARIMNSAYQETRITKGAAYLQGRVASPDMNFQRRWQPVFRGVDN